MLVPQLSVGKEVPLLLSATFSVEETIEGVANQPQAFHPISPPYTLDTPGIYWLKIDVATRVNKSDTYVLLLGHIPKGTLYLYEKGKWDAEPFGVVLPRNHTQIWPLEGLHHPNWGYSRQRKIAAQTLMQGPLYVRVDQHFKVPLRLMVEVYTQEEWYEVIAQDRAHNNVWQGMFQGAIWTLVLYHFLIFLIYRDRSFWVYVVYLIAIAFTFWDHFPAGRAALFDEVPWLGKVFLESMDLLSAVAFFWFMQSFVRLIEINPKWAKVTMTLLRIALLTCVLTYGFYAFSFNFYLKALMISTGLPTMVGSIWLAWQLTKFPDPVIRYALAGGSVMILSTLINTLVIAADWIGWLEVNTGLRVYLTEVCVLIQAFIFAMGLGYRMRRTEEYSNQLTELDRLKSSFFANVSHEFRTPLTLIMGPAQDLVQQANTSHLRQQSHLILRNARRLLHLVNQILDLAKLEAGKLELNLAPYELAPFLTHTVANFQSNADSLGVELTLELPPRPPRAVFDAEKIGQVLQNLISNALKHTPAGGKIVLRLHPVEADQQICIEVQDTGSGISAEHLPHIFDRFYQAYSTNHTTDQPSTGIGLALSRELMELHGGQIAVTSTLGFGSTFVIAFPWEKTEHKQALPPTQRQAIQLSSSRIEAREPTDKPQSNPHETILIIEDNEDVRTYLRSCLQDEYGLLEAFDGISGVQAAQEEGPDLVITDVMMPKMDGFDVTKVLKSQPATSHIPVIILTGKSSRESKLEGLHTEAEAYLQKPFDAEELRLRIRGLLNNRKKLQARYSKQLLLGETDLALPDREAVWLQQAIDYTQTHMGEEEFGVQQLADGMALDRSQLYRKMKVLTDQSPSQFINTCRLNTAKRLITESEHPISEIAYSVGFNSPAYFGRVFKEKYGKPPGELRK